MRHLKARILALVIIVVFAGLIYFVFCFAMSRYALFVERRLNTGERARRSDGQ